MTTLENATCTCSILWVKTILMPYVAPTARNKISANATTQTNNTTSQNIHFRHLVAMAIDVPLDGAASSSTSADSSITMCFQHLMRRCSCASPLCSCPRINAEAPSTVISSPLVSSQCSSILCLWSHQRSLSFGVCHSETDVNNFPYTSVVRSVASTRDIYALGQIPDQNKQR